MATNKGCIVFKILGLQLNKISNGLKLTSLLFVLPTDDIAWWLVMQVLWISVSQVQLREGEGIFSSRPLEGLGTEKAG